MYPEWRRQEHWNTNRTYNQHYVPNFGPIFNPTPRSFYFPRRKSQKRYLRDRKRMEDFIRRQKVRNICKPVVTSSISVQCDIEPENEVWFDAPSEPPSHCVSIQCSPTYSDVAVQSFKHISDTGIQCNIGIQDLNSLRSELVEKSDKNLQLEKKFNSALSVNSNLTVTIEQLNSKIREMQNSLDQIKQLNAKIRDLRTSLDSHKSENKRLESTNEYLQELCDCLKDDMACKDSYVASLDEHVRNMKSEFQQNIDSKSKEYSKLLTDYNSLQTCANNMQQQIDNQNQELNYYKNSVSQPINNYGHNQFKNNRGHRNNYYR